MHDTIDQTQRDEPARPHCMCFGVAGVRVPNQGGCPVHPLPPNDDRACTFCDRPYSEGQPAVLVPDTLTVYGHRGCIMASTIGMKAVIVAEPVPDSLEDLLVRARTLLDSTLDRLHPQDLVIAQEVLGAQTLINEAIPRLNESIDLALGA